MKKEQYVCLVCGFNMIGGPPDACPFCGAARERFLTAEDCSERYRVAATPVNDKVTRLQSHPPLGIEHAAYRVETGGGACWIDSPSSFDASLEPAATILYTHHHFLGAGNLYRDHFGARTAIHREDAGHEICRAFPFDDLFEGYFVRHGIEAFHIDGHTPGFTCYLFETTLFVCDYVFLEGESMKYNPFGPAERTLAGGRRLGELLEERQLSTVCGYNYVAGFEEWRRRFDEGPTFGGF